MVNIAAILYFCLTFLFVCLVYVWIDRSSHIIIFPLHSNRNQRVRCENYGIYFNKYSICPSIGCAQANPSASTCDAVCESEMHEKPLHSFWNDWRCLLSSTHPSFKRKRQALPCMHMALCVCVRRACIVVVHAIYVHTSFVCIFTAKQYVWCVSEHKASVRASNIDCPDYALKLKPFSALAIIFSNECSANIPCPMEFICFGILKLLLMHSSNDLYCLSHFR